ncbi:hypothetical protein [Bacillus sp. EB600]|uniref:hypothetical protein n=1 Tax=Bacillus sp. EB600 TaxID=2806345 RepID=UPI00210E9E41|nr:hypothetical protein [Bacillus sp. EB600]MCQ6278658.1 hypothetical protein [Bacillus sp. EB600]
MLKWLAVLLFVLGTLSGCFNSEKTDNAKKDSTEKTNSIQKEASPSKNQNSRKKTETKDDKIPVKNQGNEGFKMYRPKVGVKKVFVGADNKEAFTEEFVQENENYIQSIVRIGQSTSVVIYKWTSDEVSIVSVVQSPSNPSKNYLNGLKENKNPEIMISSKTPSNAIWKVIKKDETVQTPYKSFNNVYVIQKITNEVEGADTIYTYYIAPGIGIVKELYKVTGDQGYTEESVLKQVEE